MTPEAEDRAARVGDRMRPLGGSLDSEASAATALERLEAEGLQFLPVVGAETGRLVGTVTRESLRPAACCDAVRDGRCGATNHLAADAGFCFQGERADEVLEMEEELAGTPGSGPKISTPLIVVDDDLRPLGFLPPAGV